MNTTFSVDAVPPVAQWAFLNVVVALFPMLVNWLLFRFLRLEAGWSYLLRNGEMLFYAVTISAYSIGDSLLEPRPAPMSGGLILCVIMLSVVLAFASAFFGAISVLALLISRNPRTVVARSIRTETAWFAFGSTAVASLAAVFSYFAFLLR